MHLGHPASLSGSERAADLGGGRGDPETSGLLLLHRDIYFLSYRLTATCANNSHSSGGGGGGFGERRRLLTVFADPSPQLPARRCPRPLPHHLRGFKFAADRCLICVSKDRFSMQPEGLQCGDLERRSQRESTPFPREGFMGTLIPTVVSGSGLINRHLSPTIQVPRV